MAILHLGDYPYVAPVGLARVRRPVVCDGKALQTDLNEEIQAAVGAPLLYQACLTLDRFLL